MLTQEEMQIINITFIPITQQKDEKNCILSSEKKGLCMYVQEEQYRMGPRLTPGF